MQTTNRGETRSHRPKVVVLGGGISGLATGWYLQQLGGEHLDITVVENEPQPGGWIGTVWQAGYRWERGPHSLRVHSSSHTALALIEALGLSDAVIGSAPAARRRYLWDGSALQALPGKWWQFCTSSLTRDLLYSLINEWRQPCGIDDDESVYAFISRRYTPTMATRLFAPMLSGIYAGDIHQLSARSTLSQLWQWERQHGSILKGMLRHPRTAKQLPLMDRLKGHGLFTLKDGLQVLTDTLASRLNDLRLSCRATALIPQEGGITVQLADGQKLAVDHVISTLPSHALASLVSYASPAMAEQLAALKTASLAVVYLAWDRPVLNKPGFGYLIGPDLQEDVLGVIFDSAVFPCQNSTAEETRLTVMLGGSCRPELASASEEECLKIALEALQRHLDITISPSASRVCYANRCIPQYCVGHVKTIDSLRALGSRVLPHLTLSGTVFDGVAVTSCIANANMVAQDVWQRYCATI
jgi:oxygen-dependent protoporphyrinogen oxidase